jgi:hypothetical protein
MKNDCCLLTINIQNSLLKLQLLYVLHIKKIKVYVVEKIKI